MQMLGWVTAIGAAVLAVLPPVTAGAQGGELVHQGQWTVEAPQGGCGSLPLLQVKGPGTLFDGGNTTELANLEDALAKALARACPGVTEAILANGRTRRLVRLPQVAQDANAGGQRPAAVTTEPANAATQRSLPAATGTRANVPAATAPAHTVIVTAINFETPPNFPARSTLPGLAGVHGTQGKCDVLFRWLETGKAASPGRQISAVLPAQMMEIFQDSAMTAVFGKPYDVLENSVRIDLYEKTFGACTGEARRTPQRTPANNRPIVVGGVPIRIGGINVGPQPEAPLPAEYRQQFAQYSQLLHQAFGGSPGRYEPAAVTAYVQQVRQASQWANEVVNAAADAPATLEAFHGMQTAENEVGQKASKLTAVERDQARGYLHRREVAIAPTIAKSWLAARGDGAPGLPTAQALVTSHTELGGVLAALAPDERKQVEATYSAMLDRAVSPSMESATAPLAALPATWQGAKAFGAKESAFLVEFGPFEGTTSYAAAASRFETARTRVFTAVLPEWRRKVAGAQLQGGDLLVLREDLRVLFVTPSDRALPLFQQFEEPVRQRQAQFDTAVAADEQRRLAQAERAAADEAARASGEIPNAVPADPSLAHGGTGASSANMKAGGPRTGGPSASSGPSKTDSGAALRPGDLKTGSGPDGELLSAIYQGAFEKIDIDRSSTQFAAIGGGYVEGFSHSCFNDLPPNKVELMRSECNGDYWVTYNRFGVTSQTCIAYHDVGTGVFADPKLNAALNSNPIQQVGSTLRIFTDMLTTGGNPLTAGLGLAVNLVQLKADASQMVSQNECKSPALKQFQKNLQRFALGQGGLRLNGTVELGVALLPAAPGTKYLDSDYRRLIDDLVNTQSGTWAMNRYIPGSMGAVRVEKRDALGRPSSVAAEYGYSSFLSSSQQSGTVTLSFEDGRPHCLYFSDQPSACRTPSNRLSSAYIRGAYR